MMIADRIPRVQTEALAVLEALRSDDPAEAKALAWAVDVLSAHKGERPVDWEANFRCALHTATDYQMFLESELRGIDGEEYVRNHGSNARAEATHAAAAARRER